MTAYIKGVAVISPQKTFGAGTFPEEIISHSGSGYMKCIEPEYRQYIDPMVARRMSRIVKMGVSCALRCMQDTAISMPDAIIAGTGLGCLEDTEKFLTSIFTGEEKLLNPTPFIQSTHNTVAGAIALALKCHGYNSTYTQRGFSFESALQDALLLAKLNNSANLLVGGFDEITETSYKLTSRLGFWKNHSVESSHLYDYSSRGSLAGEGVAFFMLGGEKNPGSNVRISKTVTFFTSGIIVDMNRKIEDYLKNNSIKPGDPDIIMMGINGDSRTDHYYRDLMNGLFRKSAVTGYKHLCGEYDTSASFALWLGWFMLNRQQVVVPELRGHSLPRKIDSVLIYNHFRGRNHSLILLERC